MKLPGGCLSPEELVRAAWPQVVGPRIASHTRALSWVDSHLLVEVDDAVWQAQLTRLAGQIRGRLEEILGQPLVAEVVFRVSVPRRAPQIAGQNRASQDDADEIRDPVLRMLYRASRRRAQT